MSALKIVGMISGTSVDGIDVACLEIEGTPGSYRWNLDGFRCVPWPAELRAAILDACRPEARLPELTALNFRVGEVFADAVIEVVAAVGWKWEQVAAIASHGQTIWHQPESVMIGGACACGTLQIGESAVIAARTGCAVIADFRVADMAVGGQGAPLVPFADYALFASPTETRAVQNLGGIGNVTFLPAGGDLDTVLAFDTGPANMLIDGLVERLTEGEARYDAGGKMAAQGRVCAPLLTECLANPFLHRPPPRTTGREMFGQEALLRFLEEGRRRSLSTFDLLATASVVISNDSGLMHLAAATGTPTIGLFGPTDAAAAAYTMRPSFG